MKIKRIIVAMAMASAVAVPAIALGASSASAAGSSCDANHGAPGGFGTGSVNYSAGPLDDNGVGATFASASNNFGQEQGVITGQTNAADSASCN